MPLQTLWSSPELNLHCKNKRTRHHIDISSSSLRVVNKLVQTFWPLWTNTANTDCMSTQWWQTCFKLWDFYVCNRLSYPSMLFSQPHCLLYSNLILLGWSVVAAVLKNTRTVRGISRWMFNGGKTEWRCWRILCPKVKYFDFWNINQNFRKSQTLFTQLEI